jgi:hypothetical protein
MSNLTNQLNMQLTPQLAAEHVTGRIDNCWLSYFEKKSLGKV